MPKKASKTKKNIRNIACVHLETLNNISNSGNPLCYCKERKFSISPYNIVCQICDLYKENSDEKTHAEMYWADEAKDFHFDFDEIDISDDDFEESDDEEEEEEDEDFDDDDDDAPSKRKKKKKTTKVKHVEKEEAEDDEDEEDDEEEEEEVVEEEEEEEGLVIGLEKEEEEEEELDYEDEREEGLGKKHRGSLDDEEEDEEDEELEEELEEFEEEEGFVEDEVEDDDVGDDADIGDDEIDDVPGTSAAGAGGEDIDFEAEVIAKIKKVGTGDDAKEICPYCLKSKASVLRHLTKCKRAPADVVAAYNLYKNGKKKPTPKKTK